MKLFCLDTELKVKELYTSNVRPEYKKLGFRKD